MNNPYKAKVAAMALSFVAVGFTSVASANPNQASQTGAVTQAVPPKPAVKAPKPAQKPPKKVKQKKITPKPVAKPKQEVPVPPIAVNPAGPVSTTTVTVEPIKPKQEVPAPQISVNPAPPMPKPTVSVQTIPTQSSK